MKAKFRKGKGIESAANSFFKNLLDQNGIDYEIEFPIHRKQYDFKVENTLIEINPSITHNSTFGVYNDPPKDKLYHLEKSKLASLNNFRCIHVWEWDDFDKIINLISNKKKIFARKCHIKEVSISESKIFLENNHLQGSCNGQSVRLGLYYQNELVQLMTFGKPRYNKNYEYELLRLCTLNHLLIVGGAEKLFAHFIKNYSPKSIISYCDNSKFTVSVYYKLNFDLISFGTPSKHWFNLKTKQHITDNLLRQRGFDQLFGTAYGKGTSNHDLMIQHGFVEVYDCGQSSFK